MKNLIIQYYIDTKLYTQPNFNNLYASPAEQYSSHSFQIYCKKHGIDYIKITKPKLGFKHPTWERFDLWMDRSWWDRYDQIMYVDSDVYAFPHAPNIFESYHVVDNKLKSAHYPKFRDSSPQQAKKIQELNPLAESLSGEIINKRFIQPGVIILNKFCTELMLPWISQYKNLKDDRIDDGMFLNHCIVESKVELLDMDRKWNHKNNGENIDKNLIYFMHSLGGKKHKKMSKLWKILSKIYPEVKINLLQLID